MYFLHYLVPNSAILLLLASTAHAYGPYYARDVDNTTIAATATGSGIPNAAGMVFDSSILSGGNGPLRSGFSTAISRSSPLPSLTYISVSTDTAGNTTRANTAIGFGIPTAAGTSSGSFISIPNLLPSLTSSSVGTGTAGNQGSLTIAQIRATSSGPTAQISFPSQTPTSSGGTIVPFTIKATDGSDRSTAITWSAVETGSTSTTDRSGNPTIIPAPFWICTDPICRGAGCMLAIFCSTGSGGFAGFPPPLIPSEPPPRADENSPTGSANQSPSTTAISASSPSSSASSASLSSSSRSCAPFTTVADPGPTPDAGSDDGNLRFRRRTLVARDMINVEKIGSCELNTAVTIPNYLQYKPAMNLNNRPTSQNGAHGRIYNAIEKWYQEYLTTDDGKPFRWAKEGKDPGSNGSIDHVWEKSNVQDFLKDLLLGRDFDCDDLNALFFSCGNKLQKIFDQLPSMDFKNVQSGFAAMNRNLNGMKGWMFSQGFGVDRFGKLYNSDTKIIQGVQRQAIIFDLFNTDSGIQSMHDQANNRIYSAFLALDDYISTAKVQRADGRGDLTQRFGPTFKIWYEQLLTKTGSVTYEWASNQVSRIDSDPKIIPCDRRAIDALMHSSLYGREKFKIDQSHLTWHASPITLRRSLLQHRDGTCPAKLARPSTSELPLESTPTTPTPTKISTQVVTQSPTAIKPLTDELHHASPEITSLPPTIGVLQGPGDRPLIWVDGRRVP